MSLPISCSRPRKWLGYCWPHGGRLHLVLLALTPPFWLPGCGLLREPIQCEPTAKLINLPARSVTEDFMYGIHCQEIER